MAGQRKEAREDAKPRLPCQLLVALSHFAQVPRDTRYPRQTKETLHLAAPSFDVIPQFHPCMLADSIGTSVSLTDIVTDSHPPFGQFGRDCSGFRHSHRCILEGGGLPTPLQEIATVQPWFEVDRYVHSDSAQN